MEREGIFRSFRVLISVFLRSLIQITCTKGHLKPDLFFRLQEQEGVGGGVVS